MISRELRVAVRRMALGLRAVLAALAGVALGFAFEPHGHSWLTVVAVAALVLVLRGTSIRGGAVVGSFFGVAFFTVLVPWLSIIGGDAAIGLSILEGLFYGVFGAFAAPLLRTRLWVLTIPCLWLATELAAASVPFGGFPWGRLAWAMTDTSVARYASLVGVAGVSFGVALLGCLLAYGLLWSRHGVGRGSRGLAFAAIAALVAGGFAIQLPGDGDGGDGDGGAGGRTVTAAVIQGNVPGKGLEFLGRARTVTRNHLTATLELQQGVASGAVDKPDIVIWPENSTDIDPFKDAETRTDIETAVKAVGVPILVGAVLEGPGANERQTTGVVWDPVSGPGQVYAKRHPVPFGEYIPFREQLLPYIKRLEMVGRQTAPGTEVGVLPINGVRYGDVICFEIVYDNVMSDVMRGGAQVLVVQTNNATYGGTGQPEQQFAITRMRAIETGRTVLVSSTSGISGVIGPDGEVRHKSGQFVRDVHVTKAEVRDDRTPAVRLGLWPQWVLSGLGVVAAVIGVVLARRRTAESGKPDGGEPGDGGRDGDDEPSGDAPDPAGPADETRTVAAGARTGPVGPAEAVEGEKDT